MQLHVAVDQLPADSPAQPALNRVLKLMGQVVEQGHNVVRGLRSSGENHDDLERAFLRIRKEFGLEKELIFVSLWKERRCQCAQPYVMIFTVSAAKH